MSDVYHRLQGLADLPAILYYHGVHKVVVCPGSRNAPIINSLVSFGKLECISIVDERSAAYFAIGLAQQSGQPVAITCTSGTAAVNLYPAITEAFYLGIPIIALTADRPPEWIDQGDGQTIRQTQLFANHIKYQVNLPVETLLHNDLIKYHQIVGEAITTATEGKKGPVHLNIPLREPLYEKLPSVNGQPISTLAKNIDNRLPDKVLKLDFNWQDFEKKLIIAGSMCRDKQLEEILEKLSERTDVVVLAENIANISGEKIINFPEPFFASVQVSEEGNFQPDLLITLGGPVVSKRMKQFLRKNKAKLHVQIGKEEKLVNTYQTKGEVLVNDPLIVLNSLLHSNEKKSGYSLEWNSRKVKIEEKIQVYLAKADFSDLTATWEIINILPQNAVLHLANSSPVRLTQTITNRNNITYYSNRGTSGIDGCVSTATGAAYGSPKQHFLLSGDLSFIYDSNALWNNTFPQNLKIIVLNNQGGNIFNLIKTGDAFNRVKPFLLTHHQVNLEKLTKTFGITYYKAIDKDGLKNTFSRIINSDKAFVLEVVTNMDLNTRVFRELYRIMV